MGGFMHAKDQRGVGQRITTRRSIAGRRYLKGLLGVTGGLLASLVLVPAALAAAPTYDLHGTWISGYLTGGVREEKNDTFSITSMNMTTGEFSGTSEFDTGQRFVVQGTESGSSVKFTQSEVGTSYVAYDEVPELSIEPNGNIGGDGTYGGGFWMEVTSSSTAAEKTAQEKEATEKEKEKTEKEANEKKEKKKKPPVSANPPSK